jgi:hypothetical protein
VLLFQRNDVIRYRLDTGAGANIPTSSGGGGGGSTGSIVPVTIEAQEELSESSLAWLLPAQFLALRIDDLQDELAHLQGKIGEVRAVLMDAELPDILGSSGGGGMSDGGGVINASRSPQEHDKLQRGWEGTIAALEDLCGQASAGEINTCLSQQSSAFLTCSRVC